ncbi:MAG: hypothetical protein Q7Q73_04955 [Verrucomicrobiota bacterium JB024]|nr:hypothetical protein [Verrucomicrobiota bacterium JB024]
MTHTLPQNNTDSSSSSSRFPLLKSRWMGGALAALLMVAFQAPTESSASLVAIDDFNSYVAGSDVGGQNGGTGWAYAWTVGSGIDVHQVSSKAVTYTLGDFTYGGGNSLMFTGGSTQNSTQRATFTSADQSGQTYYSSFVFTIEGPTGEETGTATGNNTISMLAKGNNFSATTDNALFVNGANSKTQARNSDQLASVDTLIQYGVTYLAVVRYSGWDATAGVYETTTVWLNPTTTDENTSDAAIVASVTTDNAGSEGFQGLAFRTYFTNSANKVYIDDLRVGTSWDSVVIPEPGTWAFGLSAGVLAIALLRRRRRS